MYRYGLSFWRRLSIGCGLSLGREGPSIQLGAMAAKGFSRLKKAAKTEERLLITCGASAGLSAAFHAPIAGVLFSLEEIHKHFSPEVLLSALAASITADFVSGNVFGLKPVFGFQISRMIPLHIYGHVILLGGSWEGWAWCITSVFQRCRICTAGSRKGS
ncbi:chloride channel protein [Lachnospiraceae bacterium 54-53]